MFQRKNKICSSCAYFMPEVPSAVTEGSTVEAECMVDEDVNSGEFCTSYERKGS